MLSNCGAGEDSWDSLGQLGGQTSQFYGKSTLNIHWKEWWWRWSPNTLATQWKVPTHWKRPWYWERLRAGGEGVDRGWDGWSLTQWTWVWANPRRWWRTGKPGMLQFMGSHRVRHDWATEQQMNKSYLWLQRGEIVSFQHAIKWKIIEILHVISFVSHMHCTYSPPQLRPTLYVLDGHVWLVDAVLDNTGCPGCKFSCTTVIWDQDNSQPSNPFPLPVESSHVSSSL